MTYRIRIFLKDVIVHAQLHDGAAAKDFIQSLPMTVSMEDYDSKEKIFYPPAKLSTTGSPKSYAGKKGDLTYYSPWGNIAIFYEDSIDAAGLIPLGRITRGLNHLASARKGQIRIELADE